MYFFKQRWFAVLVHLAAAGCIGFIALWVWIICGLSGMSNPNPAYPPVGVAVMMAPTLAAWWLARAASGPARLTIVFLTALLGGSLGINVGSASLPEKFVGAQDAAYHVEF